MNGLGWRGTDAGQVDCTRRSAGFLQFLAFEGSSGGVDLECGRELASGGGGGGGGGRMDGGFNDEIGLGLASSRDSSELVDSTGNTIIVKREYEEEEDFVDVNGPFLCIKTEREDDDVISNDADHAQLFEARALDEEESLGVEQQHDMPNQELLVVWENERDLSGDNRESIWRRKDPQCEVWSCKMFATYGHSTGPSRCAEHREAWMVMFDHCVVPGCLKFGVVFSSEGEHVRCEAHAAEDRCRRSIQRLQARPLEHLVDDNGMGHAGLGLGLRLGDDRGSHEVGSAAVRQPQVVVIDSSLGGTGGESSGHSGNAQEVHGGGGGGRVAETSWAVPPPNDCHRAVDISNGATSNSVGAEIHRLKEEYEDLRQKMVNIEIELARLQGLQYRDPQQEVPAKRTMQGRPRQCAASRNAVANGGTNDTSATAGKSSLDGYHWRKYGEMTLPGLGGIPHPRVFYGCTNIGCIARKIEERTDEGHVKHCYEGVHNHPQPGKSFPRPVSIPRWKRRKRYHSGCAGN